MTTETTASANRQIARAAGVVMAGFVLSNLVGLVRQILITRAFGTSAALDAFYVAEKIPSLVLALVAGGALASAFIPTFTGFLEKDDRPGAWQLASAVLNLVFVALAGLSLAGYALAPLLVGRVLAPEFSTAQQSLTVELLRILLLTMALFGVSGLLMGILNAHQSFLLPALAPTMYWLGMIFGVLFLSPSMGVHGLAWGAVLGAGLHLGVQVPALLRLPARRFRIMLGLHLPAVREVGRLMAPRLVGVAAVQVNFLVNVIIASGLPVGSLTALTIAFQIMTMPQVVIAQGISIAALPTFSAQVARGELGAMRASLAATLRGILFLAIPSTAGLILLRNPAISLLFERGEFGDRSVELTAWALLWYTAGLVGHSLVEILSRAFYALHDTKTPVVVGTLAMALNVGLSVWFARLFAAGGWLPHGGLALANSLATALETVALLWLMRRRLGGLEGGFVLRGALQSLAAAAAMAALLAGWLRLAGGQAAWLVTLVGILLGGAVYAALLAAQRVPEVAAVWGAAWARLGSVRDRA
ncbi:MAG: murein biosynthesis integral membrane protein MurJ [Chloroflexi bacterium]|nr:murein biosynthesis integral membrane protein MurJ [Chloroflexota bacterium]